MTYAVVNSQNLVTDIHAEDPSAMYHPDTTIVQIPAELESVIDDLLINKVVVTWDGSNFSFNTDQLKSYMRGQVKTARKYKESDGIWVDGIRYHSDRESVVLIQGSKVLFDNDPTLVMSFKVDPEPFRTPLNPESAEGDLTNSQDIDNNASWVDIDVNAFTAIYNALLTHIANCFKAEKAVNDQITAAANEADLLAIKPSTAFDTAFNAL